MEKKAKDILSTYLIKELRLNNESILDIEHVNPHLYLCPQRLDLISKLVYIDNKVKSHNKFFVKEFYRTFIRAFLSYNYNELWTPGKTSFKKHLSMFDSLIDNISKNGIDSNISTIVVGKNNVVIDGAHRLAIAIYFNKTIPVFLKETYHLNLNYYFFKERGISDYCLDYTILKYISFSKTTNVIYFSYTNKESLLKIKLLIFSKEKNIVYLKKIKKYSYICVLDKLSLKEVNEIENKIKDILKNEKSYLKVSYSLQEAQVIAEKLLNNKKIIRFFYFIYETIYGHIMDLFKIKIVDNTAKLKYLNELEEIIYNLKDLNDDNLIEIKKQYINILMAAIKSFMNIKNRNYKFYKLYSKKLSSFNDDKVKEILSINDYKLYICLKYLQNEFWEKGTI